MTSSLNLNAEPFVPAYFPQIKEVTHSKPLVLTGHSTSVTNLSFSKSPLFLLSTSTTSAHLRCSKTGDYIGSLEKGPKLTAGGVISLDATISLTGSRVYKNRGGNVIQKLDHEVEVSKVGISDDNRFVVSCDLYSKIRIFDIGNPNSSPIRQIDYFSTSTDSTSPDRHRQQQPNHPPPSILLHSDSALLFTASKDQLHIFDLRTNKKIASRKFQSNITSLSLSQSRSTLIATEEGQVNFFDTESAILKKRFRVLPGGQVNSASLSPDCLRFVVAGGSKIGVYDFQFGEVLDSWDEPGAVGVGASVGYSGDGEVFGVGCCDGSVKLWQARPGTKYGLWK